MKDSLFEMLLNFFEKTLTQLEEKITEKPADDVKNLASILSPATDQKRSLQLQFLRPASANSMRIFTPDEQLKLSKSSLQWMIRMQTWGVISAGLFELIMNRLLLSESHVVSLQETKWAIRQIMMDTLDAEQLAFLDLLLYQKENESVLH